MSLVMPSLSFERASLKLREKLAFSQERQAELLHWIQTQPGVTGTVLLSTCNRTELYLSGDCGTPWRLLCQGAGLHCSALEEAFTTATGEDAARHLMEVACGLRSQLRGEDQILTQVRRAMDFAREQETLDSELAALFRMAVTVGKRVRTEVPQSHVAPSAGLRAAEILTQELGTLDGKRILVIGNGQMGRLAAEALQRAGANVTVTLRHYRHRETIVPAGCDTVSYESRMTLLEKLDAIVSATTSPHYTVLKSQLEPLHHPLILLDLAVPRDVEPTCTQMKNIRYYNMDNLGISRSEPPAETGRIHALIDAQMEDYLRWKRNQAVPETPFRFPLFIDLPGKRVVLVGGGRIAARRVGTLRLFGCDLVVIAPELHVKHDSFTWLPRGYQPGDLEGAALVIAATDDREVNRQVGADARALHIPVSVADCEAECTFYFPAVCTGAEVIAGVVSHGKDHHATARAAKEIRKVLEGLE